MDRRLILFIALSLLILLSWPRWVAKLYHIDNTVVTETKPPSIMPSPQPEPAKEAEPFDSLRSLRANAEPVEAEPPTSLFTFSQEKFEIIFNEPQAAVQAVIYKDYQAYKFPLKYSFLLDDKNLVFKKESLTSKSATFVYQDKDKKITKRFLFPNPNYNIELEIEIENISLGVRQVSFPLVLGVLDFGRDPSEARFQDVTAGLKEKVLHFNGRKDIAFAGMKFLGLRDRYFCAIIEPEADNWAGFIKKINPQESEIGLSQKELTLNPSQRIKQKFRIYLGPQELKLITRTNPEWASVLYFGTFDFIAQLLSQFLGALYGIFRNWGWVIIILSSLIYVLLFPLTLKQMRSMKQMQIIQPAIEELRKTYKDNPQKLNKEIMELYRQHKANPFSGCLPMVLQIPIFFALYQVLIRSVALKGASFLWIKDLSAPDRLFILPKSLPILGNEINILPILMAMGMFVQQKISLKTASGASAEQQKLMVILFPIMFGFIFYRMPAGLVLYWFINSMFMLAYQFHINRAK